MRLTRSIRAAALTGAAAFGVAGAVTLTGTASAQTSPPPPAPAEAEEGRGAPADFGQTVSDAAQNGPAFPAECGSFGRWVSAQARGVSDCTAPSAEDEG